MGRRWCYSQVGWELHPGMDGEEMGAIYSQVGGGGKEVELQSSVPVGNAIVSLCNNHILTSCLNISC